MELTKDKCKGCTVKNMCTTGTVPNSDECLMKGKDDGMLTKKECESTSKEMILNEYSIAYSMQKDGMVFETIVVAKSKKDALNKLYKQLGTDFYYDKVVLERKNVGGIPNE